MIVAHHLSPLELAIELVVVVLVVVGLGWIWLKERRRRLRRGGSAVMRDEPGDESAPGDEPSVEE